MKKRSKKKFKRATKKNNKRVSSNPVVRFSVRLAAAVRGLKEIHEIADHKKVDTDNAVVNHALRQAFKQIGEVVKRALKESE
jgi:hypothetical protein